MRFGEHLRSLRTAAGLTQEELAARAGLTANGVSALERGTRSRPYPHTVRALAAALELPADARTQLIASAGGSEPVAAVAAVSAAPARLPVPATTLIGRAEESGRLADLLARSDVRLVTLTGPGGVGKSRLAMEALRTAPRAAFAALAPLSEPALVPSVIAASLGFLAEAGADAETLAAEIADAELLVVLDNFEHLLAAADVVAVLLAACPNLTVLVSSRAPLRLQGECEFPVRPLDLPAGEASAAEVAASPAGALFLERARRVLPDFVLDEGNASDVAAICRRLGGIPLALELVAAKTKVLAPADLLQRLDIALASDGAVDLPQRQRTMRATLDWSYRLLQPEEQVLFRRLAVFAGPFGLDVAEALGAGVVPAERVVTLVDGLVGQSLLQAEFSGNRTRYAYLEPIREYARDLLRECGELTEAEGAHRAYFRKLAQDAGVHYHGPDQLRWLRRTEECYDDLRSALQSALSSRDAATAGGMVWGMWLMWWVGGRHREAARWSGEALELDLEPAARIRVLIVHGLMHYAREDFAEAGRFWGEALTLAEAEGDVAGQAYGLVGAALVALSTDDLRQAQRLFRQALPLATQSGEEWVISLATTWLGGIRLRAGDAKAAIPMFESSLAGARKRGVRVVVNVATVNLAAAALSDYDFDRAEKLLLESVALSADVRDVNHLAYGLDGLAVVAANRRQYERAALLLGAAEAMRKASDGRAYHWYPSDEEQREITEAATTEALGDEAFCRAWSRGAEMSFEDAVASARADGTC